MASRRIPRLLFTHHRRWLSPGSSNSNTARTAAAAASTRFFQSQTLSQRSATAATLSPFQSYELFAKNASSFLQQDQQQCKQPPQIRWMSSTTGKTEETAKEEEATGGTEAGEQEAAAPPSREEELEAQVKDLKDQLLRSLAEQDNTRRIARRDVDAAHQFAIKSFAKSLLDVSDNLSRAMDAVPVELRTDQQGNPILATLYEGIDMTEKQLIKAFEANGVVRFGQVGEVFDPNKHEALFEYVDAEKEAGTVGQVMKPGFFLNDRVLRPAEVGVVKKAD